MGQLTTATTVGESTGMTSRTEWHFADLRALFVNCTLKRSPELRLFSPQVISAPGLARAWGRAPDPKPLHEFRRPGKASGSGRDLAANARHHVVDRIAHRPSEVRTGDGCNAPHTATRS